MLLCACFDMGKCALNIFKHWVTRYHELLLQHDASTLYKLVF
ncbi:hypothetical protein PF003_g3108 [Phytophthora fragariae]|nr:hypothetical protein PF003_g3108 [Phytophthora fragariae]